MGQISKGILGGFSGKVGTVIGGTWKGIEYMRSRSGKRSGTASQLQLEQRAKFALSTRFIHTMGDLLMISFKRYALQMTGINSALAYTLSNAIMGAYPAYTLDYSKVLVSRGDMPNATAASALAAGAGALTFSWTDNTGSGKALATDKCIVVAHCPALQRTRYSIGDATRVTATVSLDATEFLGETVETWIGFISDNGRQIATSLYTGQLTVS